LDGHSYSNHTGNAHDVGAWLKSKSKSIPSKIHAYDLQGKLDYYEKYVDDIPFFFSHHIMSHHDNGSDTARGVASRLKCDNSTHTDTLLAFYEDDVATSGIENSPTGYYLDGKKPVKWTLEFSDGEYLNLGSTKELNKWIEDHNGYVHDDSSDERRMYVVIHAKNTREYLGTATVEM
jgi:hypothetical protein